MSHREDSVWHSLGRDLGHFLTRSHGAHAEGGTLPGMAEVTWGWDAVSADEPSAPTGQAAGYTTGGRGLAWTAAQWKAHPGAVRICQDANGSDSTADVIDDEPGADSDSGSVGWYKRALADFRAGTRPGQRYPCFYRDLDGLPALQAAVEAAQLEQPVPLWLAHWGLSMDAAAAMIDTRHGPFVFTGVQFANRGAYDADVWLDGWLRTVSTAPSAPPPPPPGNWTGEMMNELPTIKQGDTGAAVRTAQGLLIARYYSLGATGTAGDGVDGDFGPLTTAAVREIQGKSGLKVTGVIDPQTWPVLAGV